MTRYMVSLEAPEFVIRIDRRCGEPPAYILRWATLRSDDPEPRYKATHLNQTPESSRLFAAEFEGWWQRKAEGAESFERISDAVRRARQFGTEALIWPRLEVACEVMGAPEKLDEEGRPWWRTEDAYVMSYLNRRGYLQYYSILDGADILDALVEQCDMRALSWMRKRRHHIPVQGIGGRWVFIPAPDPTLDEWIVYLRASAGIDIRAPGGYVPPRLCGHEDDDPILEQPA